MLTEIYSPEDIRQIYRILNDGDDDPYSFPVRGMLSLIMSGKIKCGQIYVDQWPRFSTVACLQMTLEYSKIDVDILTIYSKKLNDFNKFFVTLAEERSWAKRGLLIMYLRREFVKSAKNLLPQMSGNDLGSLYLIEHLSGNEMDQLYPRHVVNVLKKMPELKLGSAEQKDVQTIVELYPSPIPAKEEMFRWMVDNLPSSALRDGQGRLMAWCLTYPCGMGAVLYVKPEHRRSHVGILVGTDLLYKQWTLYPGKRYLTVSPDNTASMNLNMKANEKARNTKSLVNWVIFTPKNAKL